MASYNFFSVYMINANDRNSIAMEKSIVMENSFVTKGYKLINSMIKLLMFQRLTQQRNGKSNAPICHKGLQVD